MKSNYHVKVYFSLLTLTLPIFSFAQYYEDNQRITVFTDGARLREEASLKGQIIAELNHGEELILCEESRQIRDTLSGMAGHWKTIYYNGSKAFIWNSTLATQKFEHGNGNQLLLKNEPKGFSYKVLTKDGLLNSGFFPLPKPDRYRYFSQQFSKSDHTGTIYFKPSMCDSIYQFDGDLVELSKISKTDLQYLLHSGAKIMEKDSLGSVIFKDQVNLREAPSLESDVKTRIPLYSFVEVVSIERKSQILQGTESNWYKIKWENQEGYVWGACLANYITHVADNDDPSLSYLLGRNALFVLTNNKVVSHLELGIEFYNNKLQSYGNLNYGSEFDFIGIEIEGHSCGAENGTMFYLWDGKELKFFSHNFYSGDGAYGESVKYNFQFNSERKTLDRTELYEETVEVFTLPCESPYSRIIETEHKSTWMFNGDSLVELPSKHSGFREYLKDKLPSYNLSKTLWTDVNKDGLEDVIFIAQKHELEGVSNETKISTVVGVTYGIEGKGFGKTILNKSICPLECHLVNFTFKQNVLFITTFLPSPVYGSGYADMHARIVYEFKYDETIDKLIWQAVSSVSEDGLTKYSFKKNRLTFENTWKFIEETDY